MATFFPFVSEGAHSGQKAQLKTRAIIWLNVGSGEVKTLSDYEVDIDGTVDLKFYKGDLKIHLLLKDQDARATSGPARLQLNSHVDENASYAVSDGAMTVSATLSGKSQKISLSRHNDGMTECKLDGYLSLTAYLAPA